MSTAVTSTTEARDALLDEFISRLDVNPALNRSLVSYQANRKRPFYRWFKYKEGFSAALVEFVLGRYGLDGGLLLDPFAGSGVSLLVARDFGIDSLGIELLPVGVHSIRARLAADSNGIRLQLRSFLNELSGICRRRTAPTPFPHLRITQGAFSARAEIPICHFRDFLESVDDEPLRLLLELACLNVLEAVSFTRKDGQYLRWDSRAPRTLRGKQFDKGELPTFEEAIRSQITAMVADLDESGLFESTPSTMGDVKILEGSCLHLLSSVPGSSVDLVVTSPPYCNRYDYTRTYALELAYLGVDESRLSALRQSLLSCTVENKSKIAELEAFYGVSPHPRLLSDAMSAFTQQAALHEVLDILDASRDAGVLNNTNVPRMVRNYFLEMSVVIFELARLLRQGGCVIMVNDNVQYAGEEVPVDVILSAIAQQAGLSTEAIWILQRGKGNSSQQMGRHGRNELRKCVYVWRKR